MSGVIGSAGSKSGVIGTTELDYEEGTWTPANNGTGWSQSAGDSRYVKVGKKVSLYVYLQMGTVTGTAMQISGIPFTSASGQFTASTGVDCGSNGPSNIAHYRLDGNSTTMSLKSPQGAAYASDEYTSTHQIFNINYEAA